MMANADMPATEQNDAELVAESLAGDRDAFRRIVERHQNLICSLAYSATGSVTMSEDLAQETFVTAWKQLPQLREYAKLRSWLCGIVRFLVGKELRRQGREPLHGADSLDAAHEVTAPEPLPSDQAISKEEGAILWRSLERIPEIYREPLVLFYREHQSIERVAEALELSEDAVKQRLSRGRKLLQEQMLAFVKGALEKTSPGMMFTVGVMAALPLLAATSASAATVTAAATKGSATGKTVSGLAALGTVLTGGIILLFSLLGFLVFMGSCFGYLMSRACGQSSRQLAYVMRFWRTIALGFLVFGIPPLLISYFGPSGAEHSGLYHGMTLWMTLIYPLVFVGLAVWLWRRWFESRRLNAPTTHSERPLRRRLAAWLGVGMAVPTYVFLVFFWILAFQGTLTSQRLSEAEAQKIISERNDASFKIEQRVDGSKMLWIKLPESGRRVEFWVPANAATLSLLSEKRGKYPTHVEGQDFNRLGRAGRWLPLLSFFIVPMGAVILFRWKSFAAKNVGF